jgi:hypothetical protein
MIRVAIGARRLMSVGVAQCLRTLAPTSPVGLCVEPWFARLLRSAQARRRVIRGSGRLTACQGSQSGGVQGKLLGVPKSTASAE